MDETVVTTDSAEIQDIALEWGAKAPFLRPAEIATDTSDTAEAVWHAVQTLKKEQGEQFDILVLLQPTSPLRTTEELDGALERFVEQGQRGLVSISKSNESPLLMRKLLDNNTKMKKLLNSGSTLPRQCMPIYYVVNGSIYINRVDELTADISFNDNEVFYLVSPGHAIDINDPIDLIVAEFYMKHDQATQQ